MGLDDDDEDNEEDEWQALLGNTSKKATGSAEEPTAEPAAEAPAAAVEVADVAAEAEAEQAEAAEEPTVELAEEAALEQAALEAAAGADADAEAAPEAEGEAATVDEAAAAGSKPSALHGDFEISDEEEEDGTLEAEEWGEEAAEGEAEGEAEAAVEEPVAAAPSGAAKAPVAKRPPVAKIAPVAKLPPGARPPVAKLPPGARPPVVKSAIAKRPPGVAPGAFRPPLAFARPQQPGLRPQQPGARPQQPGARPQQPGVRPQAAQQQLGQQRPAGGWPTGAKGAGKAPVQVAKVAGLVPGTKAGGKGSVVVNAIAAAKAAVQATTAKLAAGAATTGAAAAEAEESSDGQVNKALARVELLKQANKIALKKLQNLNLSEEQMKARLPIERKAALVQLGGAKAGPLGNAAAVSAAKAGAAIATAKLQKASFLSKVKQSNTQAKATGAASSKSTKPPWGQQGKGEAAGKGKGKGKGKFKAGAGTWPKQEDSGNGGAKKAKSWEGYEDWDESSGAVKRKASSSSVAGEEKKKKKKKAKEWEEEEEEEDNEMEKKCKGCTDLEGRRFNFKHIVVNFANVGATYGKKVLGKKDGDRLFDWEGVRRCVRFLKCNKKLKVIGVINENYRAPDNASRGQVNMPGDIEKMCETIEETPRIIGTNHGSADDEMTIKCAYRRNCPFLDNDNYRDWKQQLRDAKVRDWLNKVQELLHWHYYFDKGLGSFDMLEGNVPEYLLAQGKKMDKRDLWTASRTG